jgi:type III secretion system FlhB-like substrate exporter
MANFTLENTRNTAFTNIPRLTFQMPQSTTGATSSTTNPILFCQNGCDIEFKFKNMTSAKMKNDGTYFTITPPDNSENYINWSGSGKAGFNMIRFDLKEVRFAAPARDVVGSITYNKSIQIYFSFVNSEEKNRDIMIVISIIGQANNVGNAQTDGFILLNALANQIPLRNDVKTVTNLGNVNLGNLLPTSKAFFSTLVDSQSINYISMARIIDIPETFLNNMISRVVGGQQAYQSKVNQNTQQIPSNPQGTFIFYSENIKSIGSDQAYVCNANCDRVVGDASLLEPTFGSSTTTRSPGAPATRTAPGAPGAQKEVCEEEYVYPGTRTPVRIKSASTPTTSADKKNEKELTKSETGNIAEICTYSFLIFLGSVIILGFMARASGVTSFRGFFSTELWNIPNIPFILAGLIGFISLVIGLTITIIMINNEANNKDKKEDEPIKSRIGLIVGLSIYVFCLIPLVIFAIRAKRNSYSSFSNKSSFNNYSPQIQPRISEIPIDTSLPQFKGMTAFNTQASKILSDYQKSPIDFFKPGSQGVSDIISASKQYSQLTPLAKATLAKYNPSIVPFLNPKGEFIQNIKSSSLQSFPGKPSLSSLIDSLAYYNQLRQTPAVITQKLINDLKEHLILTENRNLEQIIKNLKVGAPIPLNVYQYISNIKVN